MKKSQKHIVYAAICAGITLALIVAVVFALVRENRETPQDETRPPVTDTDTTAPEESTTPNIPDITPSDNESKADTPGDVTLDVAGKDDSETRRDEPHIDGDVVIIPGVKGEDE